MFENDFVWSLYDLNGFYMILYCYQMIFHCFLHDIHYRAQTKDGKYKIPFDDMTKNRDNVCDLTPRVLFEQHEV